MRIDAHQHYWKIVRGDYFWMGPHVASISRDFLPDDLKPHLARHRIDATVVVQAAPTVAETEYLLGLAAGDATIAGVVGWVDLESPSVERTLRDLAARPKLVGIRPMLQDLPDDAWITRPRVLEGLKLVAELGLTLDFLVFARHLPYVVRALEAVPTLRSVIDHCAKPDLRGGDLGAWRSALREFSARPNVACKLSGLVTETDGARFRAEDLAPAVEHALEVFGEQRLVFGSDWPVCTLVTGYDGVVAALEKVLGARLTTSFEANLFGENARRLYRI
jgi:L-fuconolactonase